MPRYDGSEDLALPFEHLVVEVLELHRGQWYVKIIDRRTNYSASAGGRSASPTELVGEAWQRLYSQGVVPS